MVSSQAQYFSEDYANARSRFIEAGRSVGAQLYELPLEVKGPGEETLAIDIAWLGSSDPERVVIHSSGLHGVEGFAGSAIQLALLDQSLTVPEGTACVFVHALNPFGMAWLCRFNENNVDLNRNFLRSGENWSGASEAYHYLVSFLNPRTPPQPDFFYLHAVYLALKYGLNHLKQAVGEGQYEYPKGLFFGGKQLERGPALYQSWLVEHLSNIKRVFAIDVHTGLGKWGQQSLFLERPKGGEAELASEMKHKVVLDPIQGDVTFPIRGGFANIFDVLEQRPKIYMITQEFGTYSGIRVLHALREENRLRHYGHATARHPVKVRLKEAFAPKSTKWRDHVVSRGVLLAKDAMHFMRNGVKP